MRPRGLFIALTVFGAVSCVGGCYFTIMDMAATRDGPGVQLFGDPSSLSVFTSLWIADAALFLFGAIKLGDGPRIALIAAVGFVVLVGLFAGRVGQRVFALSWSAQCDAGSVRHCYAAGGAHRVLDRAVESNSHYRKGCELAAGARKRRRLAWGGAASCVALLKSRPRSEADVKAACAALEAICKRDAPQKVGSRACEVLEQHCK